MSPTRRRELIEKIIKRKPKHGLTFTCLSGKQLKLAWARIRNG